MAAVETRKLRSFDFIKQRNKIKMAEESAEMKQMGKMIIAIDESECSSYALKWALQNLDDKLKSGVILFTAVSIDYKGVFAGGYGSVRKFFLFFLSCLFNYSVYLWVHFLNCFIFLFCLKLMRLTLNRVFLKIRTTSVTS